MPLVTSKQLPKARQLGVANMKNVELLALLLGSGTKKQHVLTLAHYVLQSFPVEKLAETDSTALTQMHGIGTVGAGRILAAVELGKRIWAQDQQQKVVTPRDVWLGEREIWGKPQEYLVGLYINGKGEIIDRHVLAVGEANYLLVSVQEVFRLVCLLPAAGVILVHNHPSRDITPSEADIRFTKRMRKAANLLGCKLVDHIVVSPTGYVSLKELGVV